MRKIDKKSELKNQKNFYEIVAQPFCCFRNAGYHSTSRKGNC